MTIGIILFLLYIVSASLMMFTLAWQIKKLQDAVDEIECKLNGKGGAE